MTLIEIVCVLAICLFLVGLVSSVLLSSTNKSKDLSKKAEQYSERVEQAEKLDFDDQPRRKRK